MHIKIDNVELLKREDKIGKISEIRSIHNLSVYGKRRIVELPIPGSAGNVFQDMGRNPITITFTGELVGPNTESILQDLTAKFELRKPVPFSSDIAPINSISEVVIEDLVVHYETGVGSGVRYSMMLKEHASASKGAKRGPGETPPPSQEESSRSEIQRKINKVYGEAVKSTGR
jgi:hypothetical protein